MGDTRAPSSSFSNTGEPVRPDRKVHVEGAEPSDHHSPDGAVPRRRVAQEESSRFGGADGALLRQSASPGRGLRAPAPALTLGLIGGGDMLMKDGGPAWPPAHPLRAVWPKLESSRSWTTTIMSQRASRLSYESATCSPAAQGYRLRLRNPGPGRLRPSGVGLAESCHLGTGGDAPVLRRLISMSPGSDPDVLSATQSMPEALPVAVPTKSRLIPMTPSWAPDGPALSPWGSKSAKTGPARSRDLPVARGHPNWPAGCMKRESPHPMMPKVCGGLWHNA